MNNHELGKNGDNEPVCRCGYRPDVLDDFRTWSGRRSKATTLVLEHVEQLNRTEAAAKAANVVQYAEEALGMQVLPWQEEVLQKVLEAPFVVTESTRYP